MLTGGEERWHDHAAGVERRKERKVIPIGRNMVLCWLKLTVRQQKGKKEESKKVTYSNLLQCFRVAPEGI